MSRWLWTAELWTPVAASGRQYIAKANLSVISSLYRPVILSPSPSPVILSAAKDLLSLFETLLPLRTGSAKDLLPWLPSAEADSSSLRSSE